jgi:PhzF family phenazine biosynthesis protein
MARDFQLVDVFGSGAFSGNPLGVVHDADGLDTEAMQTIARWLNLSETCFLLPPTRPEADYRVRIFTLQRELPFAGHPTLGSAHAWLTAGGTPRQPGQVVQECPAGLIPIRRDPGSVSGAGPGALAFAAPPLVREGPVEEATIAELAGLLGIGRGDIVEASWADNGPGWIALLLGSAEEVLALEPARHHKSRIDVGVVGPYPEGSSPAFELRVFFSDHHGAILEDPVTGSFNASAAQWLLGSGRAAAPYVAAQGTRLGRAGRVQVDQDADGTIWIGGRAETLFSGTTHF